MPLDGQAIAALFGPSSIVCFYGENRMGRQGERGELEAPTRDQLIRYREKTRSTTHRRFLRAWTETGISRDEDLVRTAACEGVF